VLVVRDAGHVLTTVNTAASPTRHLDPPVPPQVSSYTFPSQRTYLFGVFQPTSLRQTYHTPLEVLACSNGGSEHALLKGVLTGLAPRLLLRLDVLWLLAETLKRPLLYFSKALMIIPSPPLRLPAHSWPSAKPHTVEPWFRASSQKRYSPLISRIIHSNQSCPYWLCLRLFQRSASADPDSAVLWTIWANTACSATECSS